MRASTTAECITVSANLAEKRWSLFVTWFCFSPLFPFSSPSSSSARPLVSPCQFSNAKNPPLGVTDDHDVQRKDPFRGFICRIAGFCR